MAAATALGGLETVASKAPQILGGIDLAHSIAKKYIPSGKKLANMNFHKTKKSALKYMKGLTKPKGFKKFITHDLPGTVKKGMKKGHQLASDLGEIGAAGQSVFGDTTAGKHFDNLSSASQKAHQKINHTHELFEKYNKPMQNAIEAHKSLYG